MPEPPVLGEICRHLGADLLDVAIAPRELDLPVRDVVIHDPEEHRLTRIGVGDVVLGVGVGREQRAIALLRAAAAAGAAAVVVRRRGALSPHVLAAAEEGGVAVLTTNPEVAWGQLYVLLRTSIAATTSGGLPRVTGAGLGDLFALADATAAMTGGPVTIEDPQNRVLAFSRDGQDVDEGRRATVLGRQVPERWVAALREAGTLTHLATSDDVVRIELPNGHPRRAIAIRAGGTLLGSIWLAEVDELSDHADVALREAARMAALHLLRYRVADDLDRQVRGRMLANLLRGEGPQASTLERLGLRPDTGFVVIAVELAHRQDGPLLRERLLDLVVMHLQTYRRDVAATGIGERIYVLASSRDEADRSALREVLRDAVSRARDALRVPVRAGVGGRVPIAQEIPDSHRGADQCLDLGGAEELVIDFADIHGRAILADVETFLSERRTGVSRELQALRAHDVEHGSEYIRTLRAFLDALGDVGSAAARLHVHPNTLRYRLRRILEITAADLEDPDARFALELQLRSMAAAG
jgi:sugar diacid utilization regulator